MNSFIIKRNCAKGLENLGDFGFMNAIIQCFAHIEKLTKYFLKPEKYQYYKSNMYKYKLTNAYIDLLNNLWLNIDNNNYCSLNNFKNALNEINNSFIGVQISNSNNLFLFILNSLHNELNHANQTNNNNFQNIFINQYNYDEVFNQFCISFQKYFLYATNRLYMQHLLSICNRCSMILGSSAKRENAIRLLWPKNPYQEISF